MSRDVPFDEEVRERPCAAGAWAHESSLAAMAARRRVVLDFDARAALADLRALLASPLPTRPTRERLLARALAFLGGVP